MSFFRAPTDPPRSVKALKKKEKAKKKREKHKRAKTRADYGQTVATTVVRGEPHVCSQGLSRPYLTIFFLKLGTLSLNAQFSL